MSEGARSREMPDRYTTPKAANDNAAETAEAIEPVAKVARGELSEMGEGVLRLRYDALDSGNTQPRGDQYFRAHKKEFGTVKREMRAHGGADELSLVARNESGEVEGFLAVHKEGGVATVERLWLSTNTSRKAKGIIQGLLRTAVDELHRGPVPHLHLHIIAPAPTPELAFIAGQPPLSRHLLWEEGEQETGKSVSQAEGNNSPGHTNGNEHGDLEHREVA